MDRSMTVKKKKSVFVDKVGNYNRLYMGSVSSCGYRFLKCRPLEDNSQGCTFCHLLDKTTCRRLWPWDCSHPCSKAPGCSVLTLMYELLGI